jgi:hypothetical protein
MEWRIRESGHGGYVAEIGLSHKGGASIPGMLGYTMPAFIVYESAHFDTHRQAEKYVRSKQKGSENIGRQLKQHTNKIFG